MRVKSWYLYLVYAVFFVAGWLYAKHHTASVDEFSKLFTPYVAAISALLAAAISYINVHRQAALSQEVERLKIDLQEKLEQTKGAIHGDVERLRSKLSKDVEAVKTSLAAESIAYGELTKAMYLFYFSVSKLEANEYSPALAVSRDDEMGAAEFHLARLDKSCSVPYRRYWQELHAVRQMCDKPTSKVSDAEKLAYWLRGKPAIQALQKEFEDAYSKHHGPQALAKVT